MCPIIEKREGVNMPSEDVPSQARHVQTRLMRKKKMDRLSSREEGRQRAMVEEDDDIYISHAALSQKLHSPLSERFCYQLVVVALTTCNERRGEI